MLKLFLSLVLSDIDCSNFDISSSLKLNIYLNTSLVFGYKNEFIEYLKAKNLPYGRFLEPKFKIGDKFKVHFDYYEKGETTEHIIAKIDITTPNKYINKLSLF
jgi:hypothetical protein